MPKTEILNEFELFSLGGDGIGAWLGENTDEEVFRRLDRISQEPLTKVQLNQLLVFGHESPLSDDCFRYYWLTAPDKHPFDVRKVPGFEEDWVRSSAITSLAHLGNGTLIPMSSSTPNMQDRRTARLPGSG